MNKFPNAIFNRKREKRFDFEIFSLKELYTRNSELPISLEKVHRISFNFILFITQGQGSHFIDDTLYKYEKGDILIVLKDQVHSFNINNKVDGFVIVVNNSFLFENSIQLDSLSIGSLYYINHNPLIKLNESSEEYFYKLLNNIYFEYNNKNSITQSEALRLLLKLLFLKLGEIRSLTNLNIEIDGLKEFSIFIKLLKKCYMQTRDAKEYAKMSLLSYKNLNALCKNITGSTLKKYIDNYIILEAKRHLISSNISIKELSSNFGFNETTNFIKYFKKHVNESPAEYKKRVSLSNPINIDCFLENIDLVAKP